ncbi:MAG: hypothetical protein ACREKL_06330, partial [Chthoniobacterales bacterium]
PNVNIDFTQAATAPGGYWNTSQFLTNGTLVAVPEPGETAAALAALLGAIILLRSRRKIAGP